MVEKKMILIAKKHKDWVNITSSFGCTRVIAEDIVQEMYIKIQLLLQKGTLNIMFSDNEVNHYYIFKTLKTLYIDFRRKGKNITIVHLDEHISNFGHNYCNHSDVNFDESYEIIKEALSKMQWYDRRIFEIINGGESVADFSRKSKINYYTLYFTYKKVKEKLKKLI